MRRPSVFVALLALVALPLQASAEPNTPANPGPPHPAAALDAPLTRPTTTTSSSSTADSFLANIPYLLQRSPFGALGKRAGNDKDNDNCPSGYDSCRHLGAANLCCAANQVCARDRNGHVGCCPVGAVCTGMVSSTIGGSGGQSTATSPGTGSSTGTTTTGAPSPGPGQTSVLIPGAPITATPSFVDNSFFPFPYISTTYQDAPQCSSAWSACQTNFGLCQSRLGGSVSAAVGGSWGGITIEAPNGGITVGGGNGQFSVTNLPPPAASSVCSSLSQKACYGLKVEACQAYGDSETGFILGAAGARPTVVPGAVPLGVGAGAALAGGGFWMLG